MPWSPDALVLVRPARAFQEIAAHANERGLWVMIRRPLLVALVFGCITSILTNGAATLRLVLSVPLYWSFVPLTEIVALLIVTATRRGAVPRSTSIDLYFTGHAAWTLFILVLGLTLSSVPADVLWQLLTTVVLVVLAIVLGWSAYTDYWFFRTVLDASPRRALRDIALVRLITWPIVFIIFALPLPPPGGLAAEIGDALREIF